MKYAYILLLALISTTGWSQEEKTEPAMPVEAPPAKQNPSEPKQEPNGILTVIDEHAEFPGGMVAMRKYLAENMVYPQNALENGLEGKCYIRFIVTSKGKLTDIKVVKKVPGCPECDNEALRIVKAMPDWTPGKAKGKAVDSYFNLPVVFKLN